jgi:hypothetical protein
MNLRDNVVPQRLVFNTLNKFKKYAQEVSDVIASDCRLLHNLFGAEGFIKLAAYSGILKQSFRLGDKGKHPGAPDELRKGFAEFFRRLLEEHTHSKHFQKGDGGVKEEFSKEINEALNEFYPVTYSAFMKKLPREISYKVNQKFSPIEYKLYKGKTKDAKPVDSVILEKTIKGKGGQLSPTSYQDAVDALIDKGSLEDGAKFSSIGANAWAGPGGLILRASPAKAVSQNDIGFSSENLHEKMFDAVADMIQHYKNDEPVKFKNLILKAVFGKQDEVDEKGNRVLQVSEETFIPRIDKETKEKNLERLRKDQGLPKDTPADQIEGSDKYAVNRVDKDVIELLSDYEDFTIKAVGLEPGGGQDKRKILEFTITDVDGIDPNRKFSMKVPASIGDIPLGKEYTMSPKPMESDRKMVLEFTDFKDQRGQSQYDTIKDRGMDPDEIRRLYRIMVDGYMADKVHNMPIEELIDEFSGNLVIGGKTIYDSNSLANVMEGKGVPTVPAEEAVEEYEKKEKEQEEAEQKTLETWSPGGKYENLAQFILSQGAKKTGLTKAIASNFPKVPQGRGIKGILQTRSFMTWLLNLIASEKTPATTGKGSPWISVALNQLTTGKAFDDPIMEDVLDFAIASQHGPTWRNDLKKESLQRGEDPSEYAQEKINEYVAEAKDMFKKSASSIQDYLQKVAKKDLQEAVFEMVKNKNPYVMEMLERSGYRTIVEEMLEGKREAPAKAPAKAPKVEQEEVEETEDTKEIINAILSKDFDKIRSLGAKLTEKGQQRLESMTTTDKEGKPIPYSELSPRVKTQVDALVKSFLKTRKKSDQTKKMASALLDSYSELSSNIYNTVLAGIASDNNQYSSFIRLVHQFKRG